MFVKTDESEYVEDSPLGVVNWLEDEVDSMRRPEVVDSMRHPEADGGAFLDGFIAAHEQVLSMLTRLREAIVESQ